MDGEFGLETGEAMSGKRKTDDGSGSWVRLALVQFEGPLLVYAARILGNADGARDVVQETFLRLCVQQRAAIEPRLAEWLFTVCRNRALDVLRKERRMTQLSDEQAHHCPSPERSPLEALEHRDQAAQVLDLLEGLPASQREVIRLKFQNGFSYREISRISGHSVTNVGYLIHVGLKTLRGRLQDQGGPPVGSVAPSSSSLKSRNA
jgi:RNA polymerase sigma-70 factor (ECF subfamily)